jgi:hypothetical protein
MIQVLAGTSGAQALSDGTFTEFLFTSGNAGQGKPEAIRFSFKRLAAGTLLWARCVCPDQNTASMSFYIGIHEYEG